MWMERSWLGSRAAARQRSGSCMSAIAPRPSERPIGGSAHGDASRNGEEPRAARDVEAARPAPSRDGGRMTEHPLDELAAYALGILDGDESARVDAPLRSCKTCRTAAESLAETVWTMAETQGRDAPSRVRAAIVGRARAERAGRSSLMDLFRRPVPLFVPVALAAVLVIALVGYGSARRDADRYA